MEGKHWKNIVFGPMYAGANMGHPSRTIGLGSGKKSASCAQRHVNTDFVRAPGH
jgi:hypothetical protein